MAEEITIVISAPSDVQPEYEQLLEELDSVEVLAKAYGFTLSYRSWQKDSQPGANSEGRQAHVEAILNIPNCDLFIAILWKQFKGVADCGPTNTRLDFDCAYEGWKATLGRPDLYVYFRQPPYQPTSSAEAAQWAVVQYTILSDKAAI